jgi:hypothetical protein
VIDHGNFDETRADIEPDRDLTSLEERHRIWGQV